MIRYTFGDFLPPGGVRTIGARESGTAGSMPVGSPVRMDPSGGGEGGLRPQVQDPWGRSPANPDYRMPPGGWGVKGGEPAMPGAPLAPAAYSAPSLQAAPSMAPAMQAPPPARAPMGGLSTRREPQGWAWGAFGVPWTFGAFAPSRQSPLASQLPMGRASATGSIPFMRNGGIR